MCDCTRSGVLGQKKKNNNKGLEKSPDYVDTQDMQTKIVEGIHFIVLTMDQGLLGIP